LGGPERISRLQFGEMLCRLTGYSSALLQPVSMEEHRPEAPRPRDLSLNIDKARSILKTPLCGIEEGIRRMLAYPLFTQG
ncbi:MAG: sugar nucleotide-binding protein, partial [candidate division KSB1 bacterium]|nr:sugar nucleotide-binding protein [candidate division KSB1 bacterium]